MKVDLYRGIPCLILLLALVCAAVPAAPDNGTVAENRSVSLTLTLHGNDIALRNGFLDNASPGGIHQMIQNSRFNRSSNLTPANPMIIPPNTVYTHFLRIAFSDMNDQILRQESHKVPVTVSLFGDFNEADRVFIEQFLNNFNHVSATLKFNPNVQTNAESADFTINMFPEEALQSMHYNQKGDPQMQYTLYDGSILSDTILFQVDKSGQVFVNDDLPDDQRHHYMLRAFTYLLGVTGDATDQESFFYPGNIAKTCLTETDWRAVRLLYGPVMKRNLTTWDASGRLIF